MARGYPLVLAVCCALAAAGAAPPVALDVAWPAFLARANPIFTWTSDETLPTKWYESAFIGNGKLGSMVYALGTNSLRISVSSSAIWDDREPNTTYAKDNNFVCDRPRLASGFYNLTFPGRLLSAALHLELYDGVLRGRIATTAGTLTLQAFANARYEDADVLAFQVGGTMNHTLGWVPADAQSTWRARCKGYVPNPAPVQFTRTGCALTEQKHLSGKAHTLGLLASGPAANRTYYVAIADVSDNSTDVAVGQLLRAQQLGFGALLAAHSDWWHAYYPQSFVTLSDSILESFYWINMYKLASGTRGDRVVYDLMGPWFIDGTVWPDLHWDLNIQLTYWPVFTANRLDLAHSMANLLLGATPELIGNVLPEFRHDSAAAPSGASSLECRETCYWNYGEDCLVTPPTVTGNLMWTMQLYHQLYEFSGDEQVGEDLSNLLFRAVNFYTHIQELNHTTSQFNLPPTFSPEYSAAPNCNYDLALYRWGLDAAIRLAEALGKSEPNLGLWKQTLAQLVPYPQGPTDGYWIGSGVPLAHGHRHFSHLFMGFPLRLLNFSDAADVATYSRSVDHWLGMTHGLTGFCRTAASSMNVLLDRRPQAYSNLTFLVQNYILPNTFYHEGENGECGETPPAASSAIQDWMLMEWNGGIHVFAGISDENITEAGFYNLRMPGAVLVSAARANGTTQFVQLHAAGKGGTFRVYTSLEPPVASSPPVSIRTLPDGSISLDLAANQTVLLFPGSRPAPESPSVRPATGSGPANYWGFPIATQRGPHVGLSPCTPGAAQQRFRFDGPATPSGAQMVAEASGLCVTAATTGPNCTARDGDVLILAACGSTCAAAGGPNQRWQLDAQDALFTSAGGLCMDVAGAVGPALNLWGCNRHAAFHNTAWRYNATDASVRSLDSDPGFRAGHCLTVF